MLLINYLTASDRGDFEVFSKHNGWGRCVFSFKRSKYLVKHQNYLKISIPVTVKITANMSDHNESICE